MIIFRRIALFFIGLVVILAVILVSLRSYRTMSVQKEQIMILQDNICNSFSIDSLMKKIDKLKFTDLKYRDLDLHDISDLKVQYLLLVSRGGCSSCIEKLSSIIEDYLKENGKEETIAIVFSNCSVRELQLYQINEKYSSKLLTAKFESEIEAVVRHSPLIIRLDKEESIESIFQTIESFPILTLRFFEDY